MKITAAVAREPHGAFSVETAELDEPAADEVRVRLVATGICHTDLAIVEGIMPLPLPMVLGHEGAGVVEKLGAEVHDLEVGDHVVLTFRTCGRCRRCTEGRPAYCEHYVSLNFGTRRLDGSATLTTPGGDALGSSFFGQSSFASYAIANQRNAIKVRKDAPLELLGPLGCGLSTGAGTVLNVLKPKPDAVLAIFGVGALGCAAIMAAKVLGVRRIVAVDRVASRLQLAREIGASDTVDTAAEDLTAALTRIGELDYAIDTSGAPKLVEAALAALRACGQCVLLGASHDHEVKINILSMLGGKALRGVVHGECVPQTFIPELVDMYLAGQFPIDKISKFYTLETINTAVSDSVSGKTIKPILRVGAATKLALSNAEAIPLPLEENDFNAQPI